MDEPFDFTKLPEAMTRVLRYALERRLALDQGHNEVAAQELMLMDDECENFRDWSRTQAAMIAMNHAEEAMENREREEVQQRRSQRAKRIARGPLKLIPDETP